MNSNFFKQCLAEFIGTFALVFAGCGAIIVHQLYPGTLSNFGVPIVFGGIISVMIYAIGHISGAHFNPAVTFAFCVSRHFPARRVIGYIVAQCSGAVLASTFHALIFGTNLHNFGMTQTMLSPLTALGFEIILTFFLMFVIISVATDTRAVGEMAGLAIGTTVMVCAFFGGPLTGASMNPARSLGPALFAGNFSHFWIYVIGPFIGALMGAVVYEYIRCPKPGEKSDAKGCC